MHQQICSFRKTGETVNQENNNQSGTFVVRIISCQKGSWQGEVLWADKNKKKSFRRTLELLKLIDSALEEGETEQE